MNSIPAGYQIHFTSWENDGDNYKTEIVSGLSEEDVNFYLEIAHLFSSKNAHENKGFGNSYNENDVLAEACREVLAKHPNASDKIKKDWTIPTNDEWDAMSEEEQNNYSCVYEDYTDAAASILGRPGEYSWDFCRVFESFQVYYFEKGAIDVTKEFKNER